MIEHELINTERTESFPIGGNTIVVNSRVFGSVEETPERTPIILLPGWGISAFSSSVEVMSQAFGNSGSREVIAVDSIPQNANENSLFVESMAIAQSIKSIRERNKQKLTLVGMSEGGIKAVNLAYLLKKIGIEVNGLILIEPVGLYKQRASDLLLHFATSTLRAIPEARTILRNEKSKTSELARRSIREAFKKHIDEFNIAGINYPKRWVQQLRNAGRKNALLKELDIPVIVIQAANDPISNPNTLLPNFGSQSSQERSHSLQQSTFPNSPYIRMIVGRKHSIHVMPLLRPEQIARTSLHLLERYWRGVSSADQA